MSIETILGKIIDKYLNYRINTIDGIKIEMNNSWGHLRKSNTEAILRVYSEAGSPEKAKEIALKISDLAV